MIKLDHKNEDISESVNSIDFGAIFPPRSGHELSRNASVVFVYAFEKNPYCGIGFFMTLESRDFHEFSTFLEIDQELVRKLLQAFRSV